MSTSEQIQAEFPAGVTMPEELRRLCVFLDHNGYPLSGGMELRAGGRAVFAWFADDATAAAQFAAFGAGPDGSLLALWLYQGTDATVAPVVHLGSEGVENSVLASTFHEFLTLFGIGYEELGFDDLNEPPSDPASAASFRAWLAAEYGLTCPPTGASIATAASLCHPSLEAWITAWQANQAG